MAGRRAAAAPVCLSKSLSKSYLCVKLMAGWLLLQCEHVRGASATVVYFHGNGGNIGQFTLPNDLLFRSSAALLFRISFRVSVKCDRQGQGRGVCLAVSFDRQCGKRVSAEFDREDTILTCECLSFVT